MYSRCPQNLDRGSREKDWTVSIQRNEQKKVIEKKIDRIISQVTDGSAWHGFWRIQRHPVNDHPGLIDNSACFK